MSDELLERGLPKWPQCLITGRSVTVEQAKEIIRRTDNFWSGHGGNAHAWNKWVWEQFGFESDHYSGHPSCGVVERFHREFGKIDTNYISNNWISCAFVGGPHGWCHPNGRILFTNNIGKYPNVREVLDDWKTLAREFPFIDLGCVLMNAEEFQDDWPKERIVGFRVSGGKAEVVDPEVSDPFVGFDPPSSSGDLMSNALTCVTIPSELREVGINRGWIVEWAKAYRERLGDG